MTKILGGLDSSVTMTAHAENVEPLTLDDGDSHMIHCPGDWATPTSASIQPAVTKCASTGVRPHKDEAFVQQYTLLFAAH